MLRGCCKNALNTAQVGDLGSHVFQMFLRPYFDLGTGLMATIGQIEKPADLFDCKSELTGSKDEP